MDPTYYRYVNVTTEEVIYKYIYNKTLRALLAAQFGDYGIKPSQSSFYVHASIVNHYLEGGWYPRGGPNKLAELLCQTIWENGAVF